MEDLGQRPQQHDAPDERHEEQARALEAGPEPQGDALSTRLWLARISLIVCVVMSVVVIALGTHPFWYIAFPLGAVWSLGAVASATRRKTEWDDLMRRRQTVLDQQRR